MLPPPRFSISGAARRASATSEYALTSSAIRNPSREVSTNGRARSSRSRERHAVHDEIEPADAALDRREHRVHLLVAA